MRAIAIDWSGAVKGGNIWLAVAAGGRLLSIDPFPTRDAAIARLLGHFDEDRETVAGLDFAFSFPQWFLNDRGVSTAFDFWSVVNRDGEEWLGLCSHPFWGRPGTRRPNLPAHFRRTETQINVAGITPKSCFQIGGAGAVGTGSVRGMPYLSRLRAAGAAVWPFEAARLPLVIEIYPRTLTGPVVKSSHEARSAYLQREFGGLHASMLATAAASEDAFDAAVSALVIDRHFAEFTSMPEADDIGRLEGEIWSPQARVPVARSAKPPSPPQLTRRFDQALTFASEIHRHQVRKGTRIPYISHILGVASIALEFGADEDETIGALLHDTIEDAPKELGAAAVRQFIGRMFGPRVLEIVETCTDADVQPKPAWRRRKEMYIASVAHKNASALLVSAADKVHNARAIVADFRSVGHAVFDRFNPDAGGDGTLWYYSELSHAIATRANELRDRRAIHAAEELDRVVSTLRSQLEE